MAGDDVLRIAVRAQTLEELKYSSTAQILISAVVPSSAAKAASMWSKVFAPIHEVERVRSARAASGVRMDIIENASEVGRAEQAEVSLNSAPD